MGCKRVSTQRRAGLADADVVSSGSPKLAIRRGQRTRRNEALWAWRGRCRPDSQCTSQTMQKDAQQESSEVQKVILTGQQMRLTSSFIEMPSARRTGSVRQTHVLEAH